MLLSLWQELLNEALSEERERGEAAIERAVQRTTEIVQQGMTDLKKVNWVDLWFNELGWWGSGFDVHIMLWILQHNSWSLEDCFHVFHYSLYIHFSNTHVLTCRTSSIHTWNTNTCMKNIHETQKHYVENDTAQLHSCFIQWLHKCMHHYIDQGPPDTELGSVDVYVMFVCGSASLLYTSYFTLSLSLSHRPRWRKQLVRGSWKLWTCSWRLPVLTSRHWVLVQVMGTSSRGNKKLAQSLQTN